MPTRTNKRLNYLPSNERPRKTTEADGFIRSDRWTKTSRKYRKVHPRCEVHEHYGMIEGTRLEVDHIIGRSQGGAKLDHDNLMTLCKECHDTKSGWEAHRPQLVEWSYNEDLEKIPKDRAQVYELYAPLFGRGGSI